MQNSAKRTFHFHKISNSVENASKILNLYRIVLSALLLAQILIPEQPLIRVSDTDFYSWISFLYLILALIWPLIARQNIHKWPQLFAIQIYLDIIFILIIMHISGGIESGLGILLIINIIMASLLCASQISFIFAALATIGLLTEYLYSSYFQTNPGAGSTQVGLLGLALFATAYVAMKFTTEIKQSNELAIKQQQDLENLSALNDLIIENLQSGIIALDNDYSIQHVNDAAQNLLNLTSALGSPLENVHLPLYQLFKKWLHNQHEINRLYLPEESFIDNVQIRFKYIESDLHGVLIYIEDLSIIHKQNNQSKLAALGHLTANIAHEIRNPLGAISHASQLLAESPNLDSTDTRMTEIINQHSDRINHIIEDVLKISRSKKSNRECIAIEAWLDQFIHEYCQSSNATMECFSTEIKTSSSSILFDQGHLSQILTNICDNAKRHGNKNRPIHIVTNKHQRIFSIEIADEGKGISSKERVKITEPFYTTSSKGSGLGLYIVSQLCDINTAKLNFETNSYGGTSVFIHCQLIDE